MRVVAHLREGARYRLMGTVHTYTGRSAAGLRVFEDAYGATTELTDAQVDSYLGTGFLDSREVRED